jgi:hypothetical protein
MKANDAHQGELMSTLTRQEDAELEVIIRDEETVDELTPNGIAAGLFGRLDARIDAMWRAAKQSDMWQYVTNHGMPAGLYRDLMVQVYHYTRHNSLNQAMTVIGVRPEDRPLLRFIYRHADGELGHEQMVLHDLRSAGLLARDVQVDDLPRLPATEALIGYLAGLSLRAGAGAVARLGYSYWAESVYEHIAPVLASARSTLALSDRQMTFFVAHSSVDESHAHEVRQILAKVVRADEQADAVLATACTTLWLTLEILNQAFRGWSERHDDHR